MNPRISFDVTKDYRCYVNRAEHIRMESMKLVVVLTSALHFAVFESPARIKVLAESGTTFNWSST